MDIEIPVWMLGTYLFILGAAVGSFLNVVIDRLSHDESLFGRSHCDGCKRTLKPYELIPILSYFLLGGRSRCCNERLAFQYPLVEFVTGVTFILSWAFLGTTPMEKTVYILINCALLVIFFSDARYQIIPDQMQIMLFVLSFIIVVLEDASWSTVGYRFLSAFVIMIPILALFLGTKGRGMGFGDVKLALSIGALHGIKGGFIVLYLGFITGAIAGTYLLLLHRKKLKSKIAFGPFLVIGVWAMIFFREDLLGYFTRLYGF